MATEEVPQFIWTVASQLRRRRLPLGIDDYEILRRALRAGFGWSSHDELRELCVALWAKSAEEAEIVRAAFTRAEQEDLLQGWNLGRTAEPSTDEPGSDVREISAVNTEDDADQDFPRAEPVGDLGAFPPAIGAVDRSLVMVAQYPLTEREIAQSWRRLRRRLRTGPHVELDVIATIEQYGRTAVATPPVLVPRRRNTATLLLIIDRFGSMTPFHGYIDHIVRAIRHAGRIDDLREIYFHDLPTGGTDRSVLRKVSDPFRPDLDAVLSLIKPMGDAQVYGDPDLTLPWRLSSVLGNLAEGTSVVVISDAGAARHRFDVTRLLDTIAMIKTLRANARAVSWLNPVSPDLWWRTTAGQVHRYIPMYPLTREGMDRAIDALRGRPAPVARPL